MTTPSIFKIREKSSLDCQIFLDDAGTTDIARFDEAKYPIFLKQAELMDSYFWKPTEIHLVQDRIDFNTVLSPHEQHIFTSNLKSQIMGDSLLGRSQAEALLPLISLPEVEGCVNTISYFENRIHSLSYTHILRGVYNNPTEVFNSMKLTPEIVRRVQICTKYCDQLLEATYRYKLGEKNKKQLKRALYLYLVSVNALEALSFNISFTCTFNYGRNNVMGGAVDINRLIANDESLHVAFTTVLLDLMPKDDPEFIEIFKEANDEACELYYQAALGEISWGQYLFKDGSMMGLNEEIVTLGVHHVAGKRAARIGLEYKGEVVKSNPTPWMRAYMNEEDVQKPPQETAITGYVKATVSDINENSFNEFGDI